MPQSVSATGGHREPVISSEPSTHPSNELTDDRASNTKGRSKKLAAPALSGGSNTGAVVTRENLQADSESLADSLQGLALASDGLTLVDDEPVTEQQRIARIKRRERAMVRINVSCAIEQGRDLQCLHNTHDGHWAAYCETEIEMSKRSADRYRAVWRLARDCGTDVSHAARIAWSAWLELIRDATPVKAIERAIEEARPPDALVTSKRVRMLVALYTNTPKRSIASKKTGLTITTTSGVKIVVNHAGDTASVLKALNEAIRELKQSRNSAASNERMPT